MRILNKINMLETENNYMIRVNFDRCNRIARFFSFDEVISIFDVAAWKVQEITTRCTVYLD